MVKLYADSTNDLGRDLIEENKIRIVPLYVRMGEDVRQDGPGLDPDELYAWAGANKSTPETSAFSPGDAEETIREAKEQGDDIVYFGISAEMSASCSVFTVAAEELDYSDHVWVVDTRNLSTGEGLLILRAARMVRAGKTAPEIVAEMERLIPLVRSSFVVDTLLYLYRGGRCSATSALLANALNIKPKIVVAEGKMSVSTKYRGRQSAVIMKYVKDMEGQLLAADPEDVFITHSGLSEDVIASVRTYLEGLNRFERIHVTRAGGVISSHCGPGTLGVLYIEGQE